MIKDGTIVFALVLIVLSSVLSFIYGSENQKLSLMKECKEKYGYHSCSWIVR